MDNKEQAVNNILSAIKEEAKKEQLYTYCVFRYINKEDSLDKNLTELITHYQSNEKGTNDITGVVPVAVSKDFKQNQFIAQGGGFIETTLLKNQDYLLYQHYLFKSPSYWLRDSLTIDKPINKLESGTKFYPIFLNEYPLYLSFINKMMDFIIRQLLLGIPTKAALATAFGTLNKYDNQFDSALIANTSDCLNSFSLIGVVFDRSFKNYHPVYPFYFIPYNKHIIDSKYNIMPFVLDWPRYYRGHWNKDSSSLIELLRKMSSKYPGSSIIDNTIDFIRFSESHSNWVNEFNWDEQKDINEFISKASKWLEVVDEENR